MYLTIDARESKGVICPFSESCNLPQMEMLCSFPECKVCPEYQNKVKTLEQK